MNKNELVSAIAEKSGLTKIDAGKALIYYGEVYKSLGYLGMGRILINSRPQTAKVYLQKAIKYAETKDVKKEAQALIRSANL